MQRSGPAKPVKAVRHYLICTTKAKLDFVNVTKMFQNVSKHLVSKKGWNLAVLGRYGAAIFKLRLLFECSSCAS